MTAYFGVIPIVILVLYNGIRFLYKGTRKYRWTVLLAALSVGVWYGINLFLTRELTNLLVLVLIVLFSFLLNQVRNRKLSLLYHVLFFLAITMTAISAVVFRATILLQEYVLLFLYFLTESNQRYLKKTFEESVTEYQNRLLTKQVNEVQNIYMTMRGWRHDYHNHLQTLKAHMKLGQAVEAKAYLDRLEDDLDNVNQLIESGNIYLDAILNSKLSLALKDDIEINYKAEVPDQLTVTDIDLCVVIGNLIDNAVEACNKMTGEEGEKFIRLYIGVLKQQLYISVTNATNELVRKIDEDYITTKRGNHGHGLKRINIIVEKYEGYINRKNEPGVFVTEIMLPL